ncbi:MAG: KH domain-containing protein [Bacilli bacterium]|nr:KH domain-containing protein [Bacilli bacterium]MBQ6404630.1 KH domain-containing protein [Bacilli bacterium]
MEKRKFSGKTKEEAIQLAKEELQEVEENLFIRELESTKGGLFKSKKVEIEVIEKREVVKDIKDYLVKLLKNMGYSVNIEVKNKEEVPKYIIFSDNDALLIGKNGKNLKALSLVVSGYLNKELGRNYKFIIDVNEYKEKREQSLERLAKRIAREVGQTKIAAKLDPMNSYERRIIHNILTNNKKVYTESEGEEPNRYVVIKPKEEA